MLYALRGAGEAKPVLQRGPQNAGEGPPRPAPPPLRCCGTPKPCSSTLLSSCAHIWEAHLTPLGLILQGPPQPLRAPLPVLSHGKGQGCPWDCHIPPPAPK